MKISKHFLKINLVFIFSFYSLFTLSAPLKITALGKDVRTNLTYFDVQVKDDSKYYSQIFYYFKADCSS